MTPDVYYYHSYLYHIKHRGVEYFYTKIWWHSLDCLITECVRDELSPYDRKLGCQQMERGQARWQDLQSMI